MRTNYRGLSGTLSSTSSSRLDDSLRPSSTRDAVPTERKSYEVLYDTQRSKTERPVSASRRPPTTISHASNASTDELRRIKYELEKTQKQLNQAISQHDEYKLKIRVLEDALEFRSEEIGLAGHADLLSKLANMRGEVSALKTDLVDKHSKLSEAEMSKVDLIRSQENLQKQIAIMQQRVVSSEKELTRLQSGDIFAQLKSAEQERDVLLEFIQGDMEKSTVIAKRLEQVEAELRVALQSNTLYEQRMRTTEESLEKEILKSQRLQSEANTANIRNLELEKMSELSAMEKHHLTNSLEKKRHEADELTQLQLSSLVQLKEKDEALRSAHDELRHFHYRNQELESLTRELQTENNALKTRMNESEDDFHTIKTKFDSLEPRLANLEPELLRLRNERLEWKNERQGFISDLERLRPLERSYKELVEELQKATLTFAYNNDENDANKNISLSQKHATWIGLPSLRQLCPILYERIRSMSQDLYREEKLHGDVSMQLQSLQRENEVIRKECHEEIAQLSQTMEMTNKLLDDCRSRLMEHESENMRLRVCKTTIEQIKILLQSFSGDMFKGLDLQPTASSSLSSSSAALRLDELRGPEQSTLSSSSSTPAKTWSSSATRVDFNNISDSQLPDIVGKVIMYNASSVMNLQELRSQHETCKAEHYALAENNRKLQSEVSTLKKTVEEMNKSIQVKEESFKISEREWKTEMDSATELAEKQNALAITLEAKLEASKREKQLKAALITSLQQREDSLRDKLYNVLDEYSRSVPLTQMPSKTSKLCDIVEYLTEFFTFKTKMATANAENANMNGINNNNNNNNSNNNMSMSMPNFGNNNFAMPNNMNNAMFAVPPVPQPPMGYGSPFMLMEDPGFNGNRQNSLRRSFDHGNGNINGNGGIPSFPSFNPMAMSSMGNMGNLSNGGNINNNNNLSNSGNMSYFGNNSLDSSVASFPMHNQYMASPDNNNSSFSATVEDQAHAIHAKNIQDRLKKAQEAFASLREPTSGESI